jgi:hypothetical protein
VIFGYPILTSCTEELHGMELTREQALAMAKPA